MDTLAWHLSYARVIGGAGEAPQVAVGSGGRDAIECYRNSEWVTVETVAPYGTDAGDGRPATEFLPEAIESLDCATVATYSPEMLLRAAPCRVPAILLAFDPAGTIVQACGEWHGVLGLAPRMIVGRTAQDVFSAEPEALAAIAAALRGEEFCRELHCGKLTIEFRFSAVRSDAGQVLSVIGALADVTRRKRLENELPGRDAELAHAARLKSLGEFMAGITHEIHQPLHAIATFASACQKALESDVPGAGPDLMHWTQQISKQTRRVQAIIDRLGKFCRRDVPAAAAPIDLNELIHETLDMLASEIRRHRIRLHLELIAASPRIAGDDVQLAQLLINLMRNAIDAMSDIPPSRRQLRLRTAVTGPWIEVSVEDTGVGFAEERAEQIFEPFHTTKSSGMGMGLAICRSIAEAHRGRLLASSIQGQGATFCLQLPLTTQSDVHEDAAHGVRGG